MIQTFSVCKSSIDRFCKSEFEWFYQKPALGKHLIFWLTCCWLFCFCATTVFAVLSHVRAIHINKAAISAELKNLPPTSSYSFFIVHHGCIVPLFSNIKISNHNRTDFFIRSKVHDSDSYLHACVLQLHIISTVKQLAAWCKVKGNRTLAEKSFVLTSSRRQWRGLPMTGGQVNCSLALPGGYIF